MREQQDQLIQVRITRKMKREYVEYLEWENITISEDIKNHIRNCIKKVKQEKIIMRDRG